MMFLKNIYHYSKEPNDSGPSPESENDDHLNKDSGSRRDLKEKLIIAVFAFSQWVQMRAQPLANRLDLQFYKNTTVVLLASFILASSVNTFAANSALNYAISSKKHARSDSEISFNVTAIPRNDASPSELKRSILERNIFNLDGSLAPDEEGGDKKVTRTKDLDFDAVPCTQEALPVEIVGTVFTGDPSRSFVSVKDAKVEDSDIYKAGDLVIEHEEYEVYRVYRGHVELRKGDLKICVAIKGFEPPNENGATAPAGASGAAQVVSPENVETLEFDSAFLANEIGPGYANILNAAKLIPDLDEGGKMAGFKLLSIVPGSLFDRLKLQNGDVVTDVNGVSMRDPSQGFKLYQALQEEREITVKVSRGGQSMIRKVRVK